MIKFPFTSMQQFNLDWIMQQLHKMLQFMPMNGVAGDVLQRNVDGAAWMPLTAVSLDIHSLNTIPEVEGADELAIYDNSLQGNYKVTVQDLLDAAAPPVTSVNGQTGAVVLDAGDVSALPDSYVAPVTSVNGQTGAVVLDAGDVGALPDTYVAPVTSVNGQTGAVVLGKSNVGLGNVDNVQQYSASNPPPYPVTSVNGQTGEVTITPGGMSYTLLWTNSTPTSSFPGQVISKNLSPYVFIVIEYAIKYLDIHTAMFHVPDLNAPAGWSVSDVIWGIATTGADKYLVERSLSISTSGITFEDGIRIDAYNSSNTVDNTYCRPTRIWGLK